MHNRYAKTGLGLAAAAAVAFAVFASWPGARTQTATAAEVMRQGIAALSDLSSVYIRVNMRTPPSGNFGEVDARYDLVGIDLWKQFGSPAKWRIEEPGRVVVMDGQSSVLLIKPRADDRRGLAKKVVPTEGQTSTAFVGFLGTLLDVDQVLDSELRHAQEKGWSLQLAQEQGTDGAAKLAVTIQGQPLPRSEAEIQHGAGEPSIWLDAPENRRVYRFDAASKRLEDVKIYAHADAGEVLLMEVAQIVYDPVIPPATFTLTLPEDVIWIEEPQVLPNNEVYAKMTPREAAQAFFQACADENWDEALKFMGQSAVDESTKRYLGGLKIINIGEPFQSPGRYAGWYVPYEIQFKSGETHKWNLAIRNDNPAKRWEVDGGI